MAAPVSAGVLGASRRGSPCSAALLRRARAGHHAPGAGRALRCPTASWRPARGPRVPNVVVDLVFPRRLQDEKPGRTGFAHLFEHLMFMGTKNVPNGTFDTILEGAGGYDNASTNEDYTNYFDTGPSNLLETFLWLEADRLSSLPEDMTKARSICSATS